MVQDRQEMRRRRPPLAGPRMVLPSTATTLRLAMVSVRVQNQDLRRVLRPVGSRFRRTRRMVDSKGEACPAARPRDHRSAAVRSVVCFPYRCQAATSGCHYRHGQEQDRGRGVRHAPPIAGVGHVPENLGQGLARQDGRGEGRYQRGLPGRRDD